VKGVIPDFDRITWKGRKVVIAFDADYEKNPKVRAARSALAGALLERGAIIGFLEWPIDEGKGIDDRLANVGPDRVLADLAAVDFGGWQTRLLRNADGCIVACYENVSLFFENSPEWAGVFGYNEFTAGYVLLKDPPAPVTARAGSEIEDHFDTEATRWIERRRLMVKPEVVRRVIDGIAHRNCFHPVRDYLEALPKWDAKPRIRTWLIDYCGVESDEANTYAQQVGAKFLISAVARIFDAGCKADHLLILEGAQGIGKSSAVRILAGDAYFSDQLADMGSKDASMQLRGIWIMELSELDVLNRSEMARTKAFLSLQTERFRLPYGRRVIQVPRQCVFVGTTNSDSWLKDETGGRRFWPVRCHRMNLAALKEDRDQLWAEALHYYRAGEHWWLEDDGVLRAAIEEQRGRFIDDVWQEKVIEYAEEEAALPSSNPRESASIAEILCRLGIETARQDQTAANRVARCLKAAGWEKKRQRLAGEGLRWRYRKVLA
jgi:predicted P-loop ATPase